MMISPIARCVGLPLILLASPAMLAAEVPSLADAARSTRTPPESHSTPAEPRQLAEPALIGSSSCAAATCHGGIAGRGPAWNWSSSIFEAYDPHATAGALLRDADSAKIIAILDPATADSPPRFERVLRTRCLSCHTTVSPAETAAEGAVPHHILARGVSCESCHGAASAWLEPHSRSDWPEHPRFTATSGMRDTEAFTARVDGCVRCHVGSRRADGLVRDVNHDLIAAGHPAMRFEARAFLANLPPHWDAATQHDTDLPDLDATPNVRRFVIGRIRSLRAAALLTAERVEDSRQPADPGAGAVWPELSDFDCFACHQRLQPARIDSGSSPGHPRYNPWLTAGIDSLVSRHREKLQMRRGGVDDVSDAASVIVATVDAGTAKMLSHSFADPISLLRTPSSDADWHDAVAWYLESKAIASDVSGDPPHHASIDRALEKIHQDMLRLVPPAGSETSAVDSPVAFDRSQFRRASERLRKTLTHLRALDRSAAP